MSLLSHITAQSCHCSVMSLLSRVTAQSCHCSVMPLIAESCHCSVMTMFSCVTSQSCHCSVISLLSHVIVLICHTTLVVCHCSVLLLHCTVTSLLSYVDICKILSKSNRIMKYLLLSVNTFQVEMLPVDSDFCHGDDMSLGVSSEHWFTVYPRCVHFYNILRLSNSKTFQLSWIFF